MTGAEPLGVPQQGSRWTAPSGAWSESETPGFLVRPLLETPAIATRLMRVEAGAHAELHAHDTVEQVYVLDGDFYDDAGDHSVGTFIVRQAGAPHVAGSRGGATLLLVYGSTGE